MIQQKTVFVLGTDAHHPYGLPLGSQLLDDILDLLRTKIGHSRFAQHVLLCHPSTVVRGAFAEIVPALNMSGHTSVDSFIATNEGRPGFYGGLTARSQRQIKVACAPFVRQGSKAPRMNVHAPIFLAKLRGCRPCERTWLS